MLGYRLKQKKGDKTGRTREWKNKGWKGERWWPKRREFIKRENENEERKIKQKYQVVVEGQT